MKSEKARVAEVSSVGEVPTVYGREEIVDQVSFEARVEELRCWWMTKVMIMKIMKLHVWNEMNLKKDKAAGSTNEDVDSKNRMINIEMSDYYNETVFWDEL